MKSDAEKKARRRKLVRVLRTGKLFTADDLAERYGVSARTIYRDIDALREKGRDIRGESGAGFMMARRREARHV